MYLTYLFLIDYSRLEPSLLSVEKQESGSTRVRGNASLVQAVQSV